MESEDPNQLTDPAEEAPTPDGIAIVGMAGRFPGAADIHAFWRNLREGVESISVLSREELAASGVEPALLEDPRLIPAGGVLDGVELFDAAFFGFGPREAEAMDPQLRMFLEVAWQAFEHAGYDSESYSGTVGIFGGMGAGNYLIRHLLAHPEVFASLGPLQARILTDKDFLVSLAAFKMNLTGPSINVQTACSTSMVATVLACQSLVTYQCDVALSGGSTILLPQAGYLPMEGVSSPDGKCRAFDARSQGTVGGSGAGVVVLKRLADALAEGDTVHAVIKGFATNNDGSFKMGYTAPGIEGQIQVVAMAQAVAGIRGDSITYVEAHGTGTPLGDPIEVDALTEVFRSATDRTGYCALGSVKSNIGHLDTAAGVASLIKTTLALEHRQIPPSLGFEIPNPQIDFPSSPFFVNTKLRDWTTDGVPRRAGVSSFAIGGVNAHVVLEEAPPVPAGDPAGAWQLLVLSARTETALEAATNHLVHHLEEHHEASLADIAYTLQVGRRAFRHRRALVCRGREDAIAALEARDPRRLLGNTAESRDARPAFLFPGLGNHHVGMARDLYREEPRFREVFDECADLLIPELGADLREILYPEGVGSEAKTTGVNLRALLRRETADESPAEAEAARRLRRTELAQPAVFAVEYALARLLMDMGLQPEAMLGFSVGEYVAACLSGVFELKDALRLVARRAKLISELPSGAMLAVPVSEAAAGGLAGTELSIAAVLGPELTVLAGPEPAVASVEARLSGEGLQVRRLETEHAFHSKMMEPITGRFRELFRGVKLQAPEIPFLSNVSGTWITPEQAIDPGYWTDHLRKAVRFADGVAELWREPGRALIEAGPGQTLTSWALQHPAAAAARDGVAVATMRHALDRQDDQAFLLSSLARLWLAGVRMDWNAFWAGQRRLRVPLPTYPFERRRYWLEPGYPSMLSATAVSQMGRASMEEMRPEAVAEDARKHLPAAVASARVRPELPVPYAEPRSEVERLVVLVWKDLLGIDRIGIWDGFFDLGGDSILATKLVTRLNEAFAAGFSLRSVFEKPTVADMAAVILARRAEGGRVEEARIPRIPRDGGPLPVSFSQRRLWFLDQLAPGDPFYNVPAAAELLGRVDPAVLARCFLELIHRHETLRTRLVDLDGEPFQAVEPPPASWTLPLVDLRALPAEVREVEAVRVVLAEARTPFDLSRAPLLRTLLVRLEDQRHDICVTLHHVVSDGWSNVVLLAELAELHRAFLEGRPSPLPELPIQYADFAAWQQEQLEKGLLAEQLAWWRGQLTGLPPALDLPTDRPRPPVQTFGGRRIVFVVEPEVAEGLRLRARETGATLYMLLLAAMDVLLYRHTNQTTFAVGTAIANRTRRETENLIGFFTNTLVLRAEIDPEESFRGLLGRTRDVARQAFQHQDVPFEKLVEELQPQRDLSRSPFFQVMMVETLVERRMLDDLGIRSLDIDPGVARFDFLFDMSDQGREVTGILEYNSGLFDAATAERIVQRWRTLLAAVAADGEARVGETRMLPAEEWEVVSGSSPTTPPGTAGVSPAPGREGETSALLDLDGTARTYAELRARANQLAHWLRRQGVGPDVPVALSLPRSTELLVTLLGILEAGGAYVPLDPEYPAERRAFGLKDSGAPLLLTRGGLAAELPSTGARIVDLESLDLSTESTADLPRLAGPENLAYLLYTSGSTGRPKGVAMVRGALDNLIAWQTAALPGARRTLQFTSFNFDVSYQEIFSTWASGGTLVLISEEDRRDPERLLAVLRERQVERLFLPFVALQQLAEAAAGRELPESLREVITAGEQLRMTPALVDLFRRLPDARLHNHYGPTESHVVTAFTLGGDPASWPALPPIGRPLPGTRALVLDPHGGPAPLGVPGELYLGGVCLARGYLGRPELTAERFVPDPFSGGARLYRTGDRARLRAEGEIEYLGRVDHQVKIRGYRVEPGEVEAAVAAHPGVAEGVVGIRESADGSRRLIAWVVPKPERKPDDLRAFLAERLPEHEVPSAIVFVDAFPLTPSGKVDRRRLLAQAPMPEVEAAAGFVEPRTPTEELLAGIWAEVLEMPRVGVEDDFFALGGHSLLATRITSRVRALFGVDLPVRTLFELPTVAGFAARIEAETERLVPVLTPEERTKILTEWVPAAAPLEGSPLLHERFIEQARRTPDAPAVRDGGRELTYRELDLRSDLLAADLGARGARPGAVIGVGLGRSAEAVVAILGILKAGAAWLPLDPSLPAERRATILEDAGPVALVDSVDLDAPVPAVRRESPGLPGSALAYVLYTSGSTGRPKGVCCPHAGAVNLIEELQRRSPLPPGTVCSQWASLSFDASILEIFSAFFAGGCLDVVPEGLRTDMPALASWMAGRRVGSVFLPPALLADFAEAASGKKIPLLRLQAGGEAVPVAPLAALAAQHPESRFFDCYGPTEASITATLWSLPAQPAEIPHQMWAPIGRPFANVRAYVLGPDGEPVPAGVAGELFLGGLCLAHGYLGRPDLTAERFVPDPFSPGGERMYRTADLARWTAGGTLEYLGRLDHQVKVRGFRIELGEVEAALLRSPGVVEAVALAPERAGGRRLEAFVVAPGKTAGDLRGQLAGSLPGYMIPSSLLLLPSLPRTASGKVDRRRLAEMAPEAAEAPAPGYVAPRTPQEEVLAKVWSEVLGVSRIGVHDDFFALGGHSLLATRVVSRVQKLFGVSLAVRSLFETPTVAQLAARLGTAEAAVVAAPAEEKAMKKAAGARASIPRRPRDRSLPLSFAQERIWFLEQLKPGTTAYHLPASLDLRGALDARALAAALAEIVRRHEALRTVFREEAGMPVQHILPAPQAKLPLIDLQGLPAGERDAEAERLASAWFQRPFDLRGETMLRAALLGLQPDLHRLLLLQHHIASDGWSFGVLLKEVVTLYPWFAGMSGDAGGAPLPELPIQYADFAVWQREQLQGEALDRLVDAWRDRLAGAPPATDLPTDRPRPAAQEFHGENLTAFYGQRAAVNLLGGLARSERATLFMVLLAVFEMLLQRWSGADDVVVGTPVAGRQRPELEGMIGVFINTLALRGRLDGEPTFRELVARSRETAFDAYALQELPFETLVKKLHPVRDLSRPPVFQTMFVLQNAPLGRLELPGLVLETQPADARGAKLEMLLSLTEVRGGLDGALEYNTTLFDRSTAERFLRHFGALMESAAAHPDLPASRLALLSAEERAQLLGAWGDGGAVERTEDLLQTRFQSLVASRPEAVALTWNGRDLAYGDLAARAWRLARHLRDLGIGPEVRVGVSLERSPDLVVAILAVLAAGGAYVPIEPALPAERRAFLIRDTRMPVLITRRGLLGGLPVDGVLILDPGDAATVIAGYDAAPLPPLAVPDNLAYLIYTSGSTGVPKGVAIPHRSAVAFLRWAETVWSREDLAAVLAATSVSFDLSVFELFAPLSVGGKAVLVENALRLRELMEGEGVTLINTVPSAMAEVARLGAVPPSVRVVNLAGEPLRRRLADELFALGVSRVLNLYGPSEDTTYSTWEELRTGSLEEPGIGRPIAGTRACVLDRNLEPVPTGVPGELCLAGAGLARGYLDRPDLTAERFMPDPFSAKPAARLYRTGDRARWRPDGSLEFLGRIDHQVKIRGFRIELGEIEAALLGCPGIAEAAVLVRDREGDRRLEAFLVAAPGAEPGLTAIRADLARRLPEYMIPPSIVFLAALPHTATGKVDRRALAQIETAAGGVRREYVPPRTEVETWLVETCSALLGVEHVGLRDRFFDLGGHSLLATQLIARLREGWQVDLPLQDVFAATDLGDLADRITDLGLGQAGDDDLAEALAELGVGPEDLDALLKG